MNRKVIGKIVTLWIALGLSHMALAQGNVAGMERWATSGRHECLHVWNGAVWAATDICRRFPDARNPGVWDIYSPLDSWHRAQMRLAVDTPGWIRIFSYAYKKTLLVPNRGSIVNLLNVGLDSIYVLGVDQRWYNLAALNIAHSGQPGSQPSSGDPCRGIGGVSNFGPQNAQERACWDQLNNMIGTQVVSKQVWGKWGRVHGID